MMPLETYELKALEVLRAGPFWITAIVDDTSYTIARIMAALEKRGLAEFDHDDGGVRVTISSLGKTVVELRQ